MVVTVAAWCAALGGAFQFDDFENVVRDPATTDATALFERLGHGLRPLTRLSYFIDAHVYGMRAWGFLATNLMLHVAAVLLVFALCRRQITVAGACVAALVFALQPAHGEVIAYVSGRSTGLMTALLLGALVLHDRERRVLAVGSFVLACLAKEVALVFPLLVVIWDTSRGVAWRDCARAGGRYLIAAAIVFGILMLLANHRAALAYSIELRSPGETLLANGHAASIMLSLWGRPWALSVDHAFEASPALGLVGVVVLFVAALAGLAFRKYAALAVTWPVIALVPTTSIIAKLDYVTEKPLYLAWVGPAIALGVGFSAVRSRTLARVCAAALVAALGIGSVWRARMWSDPIALWEEGVAKAPNKARCWNNLGIVYQGAARDREAVAAFERALQLDPNNEYAATNLETARWLCGEGCGPGRE